VRERGCWRLDAFFRRDLKGAFECQLNLPGGFFTCFSVCHDAWPFDDLSDEALVAFLS
jgi:hypothetical protein